jgi:hypothetical protein
VGNSRARQMNPCSVCATTAAREHRRSHRYTS